MFKRLPRSSIAFLTNNSSLLFSLLPRGAPPRTQFGTFLINTSKPLITHCDKSL